MGEIWAHLYKQPGHRRHGTRWQAACFGLGFGLLAGAASAQSGAPTNFGQKGAPMPRGSFLETPAKSVKSLNKELDDPVVLERYSKLFNMPASLVRLALADLKLQPLPEDRNMEVWYVKATPKGEVSGYRLRKVKKGTLVYAMQDGTPALIQVCGNPVRIITAPSSPITDIQNLPEYEPYSLLTAPALVTREESPLSVATLDAAPDDFVEVSMPDVPLPVPVEPPQLLAAHAKRLFALWFLPLLAAIPAFSGGGGGGGGGGFNFLPLPPPGGGITVPPIFTPPPSAVPEPGAISLLAGLTAGGAICWRRRKK